MPIRKNLKHFVIKNSAKSEAFTSTNSFGAKGTFPNRPRQSHARKLLTELRAISRELPSLRQRAIQQQLGATGIFLEFSGSPGFDLALESLDLKSKKIELVSVKTVDVENRQQVVATVFVPNDKISVFINKVEQYKNEETKNGNPKNQPLVNGIESIRFAVLESFWTDTRDLFPQRNEKIWWEVWLRADQENVVDKFRVIANNRQFIVNSNVLDFLDRKVVLAYFEPDKIADSIECFDLIAELRRAKETTSEFLSMYPREQQEWSNVLRGLTNPLTGNEPTVCILDTGVSRANVLIQPFLQANKQLSLETAWGVDDHDGHGSGMAGIALYRDLNRALLSTTRITIHCQIESVKLLPPPPTVNDPQLYGSLTEMAVALATTVDPFNDRILTSAVTSIDGRDRGKPSSWSAAVDKICSGVTIEDKRHLFILSAGNTDETTYHQYPHVNELESVHDPAQSWNALTVGAYTEKNQITDPAYITWQPLAAPGDLAPSSTTSLTWERNKWPIKPDVVFEGGNAAKDPASNNVVRPESMLLLSTNRVSPGSSLFTWMADTSAAAAEASNLAAQILNRYPDFWPETLRALIVHSAEWTPQMLSRYPTFTRVQKETLLRCCGFGIPSLERALYSASNYLTLIAQDSIKPYDGKSMNELNLHKLPWPAGALEALGDTEVQMRVTLSYFIEPYPARRGWTGKFRYQSHGLRFEMKTADEDDHEFRMRINRSLWDEELGRSSITSTSDSEDWYFGPQIRTKGSIHSDIWRGKASDLAKKTNIGVYPVIGWWREKHRDGYTENEARYSLIVTITTPSTDMDIYTSIESMINVPTPVTV